MRSESSSGDGRPRLTTLYPPLSGDELFPSILNSLEQPFFLLDDTAQLIWHNKACNQLYHAVSGKQIDDRFELRSLLTGDQYSLFMERFSQVITGHRAHFEWKYQLSVVKWLSVSLYPFRSDDGSFTGVCGSIRDITERKKTEDVIREKELRYRALVNSLSEGVILQTTDKGVLAVNKSAAMILGVEVEDLKEKGFPFPDWVLVDEGEKAISHEGLFYRRNGRIHTARNKVIGIRRANSIQWLKLNAAVIVQPQPHEPLALVISFEDITEQKRISAEIEVLALLARETVNAVCILAHNGELLWINEGFSRLTGYSPEELLGKTSRDILQGPESNPETVRRAAYCRQNGIPFTEEFVIYTKQGKKVWTRVQGQTIRMAHGKGDRYFAIVTDITEEKKIMEELEVLSLVAKETTNSVVIFDKRTECVTWVNEGFTRLTGYGAEEVVGRNPMQLLSGPETDLARLAEWVECIKHDQRYSGDLVLYTKDGQKRIHHVMGEPFRKEGEPVTRYFAVGSDITERRRLEEERLQYEVEQQKKITRVILQTREVERNELGRELHDNINQILAATRLQLSYCIQNFDDCQQVLEQCRQNVIEAMEETRRLSHKMVMPRFAERSLIQVLKTLVESYRYAYAISLDIGSWDDERANVGVKEAMYRITQEQLSNIYKHAHARMVIIRMKSDGSNALLTVEDDGVGFDTSEKKNGIGISNIHCRAESCGGTAEFVSSPGAGCVLSVRMPLKGSVSPG